MSAISVDEVYHQAKLLSPADQQQLFERLREDIAPEPPNTFHTEDELKQMLRDGLTSGPATAMTDDDWEDIRQEVRDRAARRNEAVTPNA